MTPAQMALSTALQPSTEGDKGWEPWIFECLRSPPDRCKKNESGCKYHAWEPACSLSAGYRTMRSVIKFWSIAQKYPHAVWSKVC